MTLMFYMCKRLSKKIRNIIFSFGYFAYFDFTSIINFSDKVKLPEYMFGPLLWPGLICLNNSTAIITEQIYGFEMVETTPSSVMNFLIQIASLAASDVAIYSASVIESFTVLC